MVWSVISYGAGVWGSQQFSCISAVQARAARFFLGVGKYTPNAAVSGDTGWNPIFVKQWESVINQWYRLRCMPVDRINSKVYQWSTNESGGRCKNQSHRIKQLMVQAGIADCFNNESEVSKAVIKEKVKEYLFEKFKREWYQDVTRENAKRGEGRNKLRTYKLFKDTYGVEHYVQCVMPTPHRSAFAKFRCGVAPIRLETGRYERLSEQERTCFCCEGTVESEEHVLLECPTYDHLRKELYRKITVEYPNFSDKNNIEKLTCIFSSDSYNIIRTCAKICYDILKLRRTKCYK